MNREEYIKKCKPVLLAINIKTKDGIKPTAYNYYGCHFYWHYTALGIFPNHSDDFNDWLKKVKYNGR